MRKIEFVTILIFQVLFFAKLSSQAQYNRFMIAWYDFSNTETSVSTITQRYKDMKTHNINCAITEKREKKIIFKRNILYLCK